MTRKHTHDATHEPTNPKLPPIPSEELRLGVMGRKLLKLYYEWIEQGKPMRQDPEPTT